MFQILWGLNEKYCIEWSKKLILFSSSRQASYQY